MADPVVEDYLRRLDTAAAVLPGDRRRELVEGISEHIAEARESGAVTTEAGLRTLLDRLGEPEEIVAAAHDFDAPPDSAWSVTGSARTTWRRPGTGRETAAVLLMTAGSIIPVVGWLCGVVLLWTSRRWKTWEKLLATFVVPGGPFVVLVLGGLFAAGSQTCSSSGTAAADGTVTPTAEVCTSSGFSLRPEIGIPAVIAWIILPVVIDILLLVRARNRAALEPPVLVRWPTLSAQWGPLEVAAVLLIGVGAFAIPFVGPLTGLVCAWISPAWTAAEKRVATVLVTIPVLLGLALFLSLVGFIA